MRKEYLLKYLINYGYVLVYYSLGEKLVRMKNSYQNLGKNYDLSGSFLFEDGYIKEIKPMSISQTFPPPKKKKKNTHTHTRTTGNRRIKLA